MSPHNHQDDDQEVLLTCDVCMKEIPKSVAQSLEGPDYVQHFCGNECYDKWREQKANGQQPKQAEAKN